MTDTQRRKDSQNVWTYTQSGG